MRENYPDIFGNLGNLPTNFLYAKKIMNDSNFKFEKSEQKKVLSDFIQAPVVIDQQIMSQIETYFSVKYK